MSGISSINGNNDYTTGLTTGKKINSAADDASGLTIAEKLDREAKALEKSAENAQSGINMLNVADGALGGIVDSLQRISELSVKAGGIMASPSDLNSMQDEIDQLLQGIQDIASNTEFNSHKLLDGSFATMDIATNPNGKGSEIQMVNSTLEALGIEDYNVTGNFDSSKIEDAINMVTEAMSNIGASTNSLQNVYESNKNISLETMSAKSAVEDLDYAEAITEQKKLEGLATYQNVLQRNEMQRKEQESIALVTQI